MKEVAFNGLVGPTHSYSGLAPGNLAATAHAGQIGNPRAAALQGLEKIRTARALGAEVGVLPPHPRPDVATLRRLGFSGSDADVLTAAADLLPHVASASSMWAANSATCIPSADASDRRMHLVVANLSSMFHRSLEAPVTTAVLRTIFAGAPFAIHDALPSTAHFSDEGAANHIRLSEGIHVFGWGRRAFAPSSSPAIHPARQTLEASQAVARITTLPAPRAHFWQQHPSGIDAGAFHTDVLAVGAQRFLMLHELAFADVHERLRELASQTDLEVALATNAELPVAEAVAAYPFNSELLPLRSGKLAILAPTEARATPSARRFLEQVASKNASIERLEWVDVNASMKNGGGPACLRLRVWLEPEELASISARVRVLLDDALQTALETWVRTHYRDRLAPEDLADPQLLDESHRALDELTEILGLGSVYDFQKP